MMRQWIIALAHNEQVQRGHTCPPVGGKKGPVVSIKIAVFSDLMVHDGLLMTGLSRRLPRWWLGKQTRALMGRPYPCGCCHTAWVLRGHNAQVGSRVARLRGLRPPPLQMPKAAWPRGQKKKTTFSTPGLGTSQRFPNAPNWGLQRLCDSATGAPSG